MRSSVNAALESNATRSISSGLVNRLGWWSSFWSDIYPFGDAHLLPADVGFAAVAVIQTWPSRVLSPRTVRGERQLPGISLDRADDSGSVHEPSVPVSVLMRQAGDHTQMSELNARTCTYHQSLSLGMEDLWQSVTFE